MRTKVTSSNIAEAAIVQGKLELTFHNGSVYSYAGAGVDVYHALLRAPSQGKFFHAEIRPKYTATRVSDVSAA
jgi:hypothetical protein